MLCALCIFVQSSSLPLSLSLSLSPPAASFTASFLRSLVVGMLDGGANRNGGGVLCCSAACGAFCQTFRAPCKVRHVASLDRRARRPLSLFPPLCWRKFLSLPRPSRRRCSAPLPAFLEEMGGARHNFMMQMHPNHSLFQWTQNICALFH